MSLPNAVLLIGHRRLRNIFGKGPDCYRGGTHCRIVSCVPDTNQKLNEALSSPIIWEKQSLLCRVVMRIQTITEMPSTPAPKCLIMTDSIFLFSLIHSFIKKIVAEYLLHTRYCNDCWDGQSIRIHVSCFHRDYYGMGASGQLQYCVLSTQCPSWDWCS